jgi:hypothetical protein
VKADRAKHAIVEPPLKPRAPAADSAPASAADGKARGGQAM